MNTQANYAEFLRAAHRARQAKYAAISVPDPWRLTDNSKLFVEECERAEMAEADRMVAQEETIRRHGVRPGVPEEVMRARAEKHAASAERHAAKEALRQERLQKIMFGSPNDAWSKFLTDLVARVRLAVSEDYGILLEYMTSSTRSRRLSDARMVATYIAVRLAGASHSQIALYLGLDRTTVTHARNQIMRRTGEEPELQATVDRVMAVLS